MKLLINASTLSGTGVTQVAVSFIEECKLESKHIYYILMSKQVASQIDCSTFPENFRFYNIEVSPRFLWKGRQVRKAMRELEHDLNPDCTFSVFGPSYWTPKSPHLMGFAYPHYVYRESPLFSIMSIKDKFKTTLYRVVHRYLLKKNGGYYVCETDDVGDRLANFLSVSRQKVFTVTNTYNHFFSNFVRSERNLLPEKSVNDFRFLSLCTFAQHKNLEILNRVIPILNSINKKWQIKFVLTVDESLYETRLTDEAKSSIINLGRVDVADCPQLYQECDALFLPTLLECFSANYPEAMKMQRPILTSDLSFATEVCKDAALYFNPLDPFDIANKIMTIIEDKSLQVALIDRGLNQLQFFHTAEERAIAYLEICEKIKR